ncbi:MAG: hypothetical protein ACR2IA_12970 [Pyrinomonadaceae bacterium]
MENKIGTAAKQIKETIENGTNSTENIKDKVVQKVGETKEKVTENLSTAADKFHEKSDTAQEFLASGADNLNEYAHQAIGKVNQIGHRAADALSSSSDYINNFDYEKTKQQVVETIKEKPQIGLAIAGLFGLIIGLILGRRNSKNS